MGRDCGRKYVLVCPSRWLQGVAFFATFNPNKNRSLANMGKTNTRWFQSELQRNNITQRRVARALNLDPSSITLMFHGKRKLQIKEAVQLANLFGVPLDDVLSNAGLKTETKESTELLPIEGWIDGEMRIHWGQPKGQKTAPIPSFGGKNIKVLRYQTIGSNIESLDGGLVYYSESKGLHSDSIGRLCVVKRAEDRRGSSLLAVVKRGYSAGAFNLVDLAGRAVMEDAVLESASPVIWLKL
jgi:transcriptional regulator with XRE-family HTH domain